MVDLASLIAETQKTQKTYLQAFKDYINQSVELKKNIAGLSNDQLSFVAQAIESLAKGTEFTASPPDDKSLEQLWKVLMENKDYINSLSSVVLPEPGTQEDTIKAIEAYMSSALKARTPQE